MIEAIIVAIKKKSRSSTGESVVSHPFCNMTKNENRSACMIDPAAIFLRPMPSRPPIDLADNIAITINTIEVESRMYTVVMSIVG